MEICKCSCHHNPLLFHFNKCCEYQGKIYINDDGTIDMSKYLEVIGKKEDDNTCPCCGGSGKINKNS